MVRMFMLRTCVLGLCVAASGFNGAVLSASEGLEASERADLVCPGWGARGGRSRAALRAVPGLQAPQGTLVDCAVCA